MPPRIGNQQQSPTPASAGGSASQVSQGPASDEQAELDRLQSEMDALDAAAGDAAGPLVVAPGRTIHYSGKHHLGGKAVRIEAGQEVPFSPEEMALGEAEKLRASGHLVPAGAARKYGVSEEAGGEGARVSAASPDAAG